MGRDFLCLLAAELCKPSPLVFLPFFICPMLLVPVFRLMWGQVFVNWPPSSPSPACSLSLSHTQRDKKATNMRARPGKSVHSKSLSLFHHITSHSSSSDGKLKSGCQCAPSMSFLWLTHQQLPWAFCKITYHRARNNKCHGKASLSLAVLGGLPALNIRVPSSALQSTAICLFMLVSQLFSLNSMKQPDSGSDFHHNCACVKLGTFHYLQLGSSNRIAKGLNYSSFAADSALKLHSCFLR